MLLSLLLLAFIAIQTDFVQNWLLQIATTRLSAALQTEVSIEHISFSLFNKLNLEGTLVRDQRRDTLVYAQQFKVRITDWFFLKDKPELKFIGLENATIKLKRTDSVWNYAFIANYFVSPTPNKNKNGGLDINLKKLDFKNVRFIKDDRWVGEKMTVQVGSLLLDADNIDFNKKIFQINDVLLDHPYLSIQSLDPLRPASIKKLKNALPDTGMYLNEGNISLQAANVKINDGKLLLDDDNDLPSKHFDGAPYSIAKTDRHFKKHFIHKRYIKGKCKSLSKRQVWF